MGQRLPRWLADGVEEYAKRLPKHLDLALIEIAPGQRAGGNVSADTARATESERILARLGRNSAGSSRTAERVIALDEAGQGLTTMQVAQRLADWQQDGQDIAFLIGGADGLHPDCLARADHTWSLSKLTLPHGLARLLLVEQLYRAWSINSNHPYHRA